MGAQRGCRWPAVTRRAASPADAPSRSRSSSGRRCGTAEQAPTAMAALADAALRIDIEQHGDRDDGDHQIGARAELEEGRARALAASVRHADGGHQLVRRQRGPAVAGDELRQRQRAPSRARWRSRRWHSSVSSGGTPSAAGEALQMLPAMVPRFCTCTPPTSRAAQLQPVEGRRQGGVANVGPGGKRAESDARRVLARMPFSSAMAEMSSTLRGVGCSQAVRARLRRIEVGAAGQHGQPIDLVGGLGELAGSASAARASASRVGRK